jgi:hypothetical protein
VRQHIAGAPLQQLRKRQVEMLHILRIAQIESRRENAVEKQEWRQYA